MSAPFQNRGEDFGFIPEYDNEFLRLFSHRWDFLCARHPKPGERPKWYTENRYPLSDRQIQQREHLYGVRFGKQTNYCLLDLDPTSLYHPQNHSSAVEFMMNALERIGLVSYLPLQSSHRGGVHIYIPFEQAQPSWAIAQVIQTSLEGSGFEFDKGQLEIFPHPRAFIPGDLSLYHGHRLPLQAGSCLLDEGWEPTSSTQAVFVERWRWAQRRNCLNIPLLKQMYEQLKSRRVALKGRAQKFLNDLNTEIDPGWTGVGQTNHILGKIACRERVFHHVLSGSQPLSREALAERIVEVAQVLPGYEDFCRHQHELEKRAREYARSSAKRYYPFMSRTNKAQQAGFRGDLKPSWNQLQAEHARKRIKDAFGDLVSRDILPAQVKARLQALKGYGIGSDALYRNRVLWHPKDLKAIA